MRWPIVVPLAGIALVLVGVVLFGNLNGSLVYYLTPSEAVEQHADFPEGRRFRLAGEVVDGTVETTAVDRLSFDLADDGQALRVDFLGHPQELFRPGIDVVVEGSWQGDHIVADTMLVKHDENYRVPDVQARP